MEQLIRQGRVVQTKDRYTILLIFPGKTEPLGTSKGFRDLKNQLWAKNWVVYSKPPFAGPEQVLDYLGRYTHRVAISTHPIVEVKNCKPAGHRSRSGEAGGVIFQYRHRKDNDTPKLMELEVDEFIRRRRRTYSHTHPRLWFGQSYRIQEEV